MRLCEETSANNRGVCTELPALEFPETEQEEEGKNLSVKENRRINKVVVDYGSFYNVESIKMRLRRGQGGNSALKMNRHHRGEWQL